MARAAVSVMRITTDGNASYILPPRELVRGYVRF